MVYCLSAWRHLWHRSRNRTFLDLRRRWKTECRFRNQIQKQKVPEGGPSLYRMRYPVLSGIPHLCRSLNTTYQYGTSFFFYSFFVHREPIKTREESNYEVTENLPCQRKDTQRSRTTIAPADSTRKNPCLYRSTGLYRILQRNTKRNKCIIKNTTKRKDDHLCPDETGLS